MVLSPHQLRCQKPWMSVALSISASCMHRDTWQIGCCFGQWSSSIQTTLGKLFYNHVSAVFVLMFSQFRCLKFYQHMDPHGSVYSLVNSLSSSTSFELCIIKFFFVKNEFSSWNSGLSEEWSMNFILCSISSVTIPIHLLVAIRLLRLSEMTVLSNFNSNRSFLRNHLPFQFLSMQGSLLLLYMQEYPL